MQPNIHPLEVDIVLSSVFSYLNLDQVLSVSRVSRRWWRSARQRLDGYRLYLPVGNDNVPAKLMEHKDNLRHLKLQSCPGRKGSMAIPSMRNLTNLVISLPSDPVFLIPVPGDRSLFPRLKNVTIEAGDLEILTKFVYFYGPRGFGCVEKLRIILGGVEKTQDDFIFIAPNIYLRLGEMFFHEPSYC